MSFINKLINSKNFYLTIIISVLFLNTFFINKTYASSFQISNIEIHEKFDLNFNKKNVFEKAFKTAFIHLTSMVTTSKDKKKLKNTNNTTIKSLIDSFEISDEKFLKDEYVAGAYIQKFFIFSLVLFPFFLKKLENKKFITSIFLTTIFFTGILYSGNRMPLMMFIFSIFFIMIFIKNLRFPIVIGALLCSIIFYTSIKNNENLKSYYISFYSNVIFIADSIKKYSFEEYPELENKKGKRFVNEVRKKDTEWVKKYKLIPYASGHAVTYLTAIDLWTDSPIIGNGIKSFRIKCLNKLYLPNRNCQTHPHNYYLELLNDTGLVGTLFLLFAIFFLLKNKFLNFKYYKKKEKLLAICIFIIIISEFFPIRSTGSFFSTYNSSFIFFVLGILNGLKKIKI